MAITIYNIEYTALYFSFYAFNLENFPESFDILKYRLYAPRGMNNLNALHCTSIMT